MKFNLLIKLALIALGLTYIGLQAFEQEIAGSAISAIMLVLLTFLYIRFSRIIRRNFLMFLAFFSIAQIIGFFYWYMPVQWKEPINFPYYIANMLYITAYLCLINHLVTSVDFAKVLRRLTGPAIILIVLDIFCVYVVTDTASSSFTVSEYILEFVYNGVIMLLLSVALLNYLYKDSNKAMLFLIGTIFIVFSEIIQLAYFYVLESNDLSATYATFLVMAFLFFYLQSQIHNSKSFADLQDEKLNVSSDH